MKEGVQTQGEDAHREFKGQIDPRGNNNRDHRESPVLLLDRNNNHQRGEQDKGSIGCSPTVDEKVQF